MASHRKIDSVCLIITAVTLLITVLFMCGESLGIRVIAADDGADAEYVSNEHFTGNDQNGTWDASSATVITLKGDSITISGGGAYAFGREVFITEGGRYLVSGELENGSIVVDAYKSSKVWIRLSGVTITREDDACIRVEQAKKVFITLTEGTENVLTSGETYSEKAAAEGRNGAIWSDDDLTVNGSGTLTVKAGYKHGIDANDDLVITGGTLHIEAAGDGLHANSNIRIMDAEIVIVAGDDGVQVQGKKDDSGEIKEGSGYFYMESGSLTVFAIDKGLNTYGETQTPGGTRRIIDADD